MARAIDKQTMLNLIIEAKRTDPETGSFAEWLAEYLAEHLPTLTPPNEWVSVEERIPNFGKLVIATDGTTYGVAWLCSDCTWMVTMGYKSQSWFGRKITHWMPLPAPPDSRTREGGDT